MTAPEDDGGEPGGPERRAGTRHPIEIPIEVTVGTEMAIHATSNLSRRGAFFARAIPYAAGTRVGLRILLPGDPSPIECQGEIVNIPDAHAFGMGVRFDGLSDTDERRIDRFAARYAP